jgi:hypothetical protein
MQLSQADVNDSTQSYLAWKAIAGTSAGPYLTPVAEDQNSQILATWAEENLPGGLHALKQIGGWQIAFRECLKAGVLVQDPAWHPDYRTPAQRKGIYRVLYDSLTARQLDAIYHGTSDKLDQLLTEEQSRQLTLLGGTAGFRAEYEISLGGK